MGQDHLVLGWWSAGGPNAVPASKASKDRPPGSEHVWTKAVDLVPRPVKDWD
jgi:hypothetical protein